MNKQRRKQHERKKLCPGNGEMDGRGRYQEHLQRQLDMSYQNVFSVGDSEKEMLELTVEMGGMDVTGSCVVMAEDNASAQIKMASVTGNIKITAHAAAKPVAAMLCADILPVEVKPLKRVEGAFRLGR